MKLFGHPMSTCTRKVLTVLAEKEAKFDFVMVDIMKGEGKTPAHLARQPFGQVPAWQDDDGFMLYESRAICRYLDETLSGKKLVPSAARDRATMEQWVSVETTNFTVPAMKVIYEAMFKPMMGSQGDAAVIEENKKKVATAVGIMETQLRKTPFIAGAEFTLADISFMPYIDYLAACGNGDVIERSEATHAWWKKIEGRPSWKAATSQKA